MRISRLLAGSCLALACMRQEGAPVAIQEKSLNAEEPVILLSRSDSDGSRCFLGIEAQIVCPVRGTPLLDVTQVSAANPPAPAGLCADEPAGSRCTRDMSQAAVDDSPVP